MPTAAAEPEADVRRTQRLLWYATAEGERDCRCNATHVTAITLTQPLVVKSRACDQTAVVGGLHSLIILSTSARDTFGKFVALAIVPVACRVPLHSQHIWVAYNRQMNKNSAESAVIAAPDQ